MQGLILPTQTLYHLFSIFLSLVIALHRNIRYKVSE